jgi:phage pi2 protein 07
LSKADGETKHWWEIFFGMDLPRRTKNINLITYEFLIENQRQQEILDYERKKKEGKVKSGEIFNPDAENEVEFKVKNFQRFLDEKFEVIYDGIM